jgi:hypothetical protein
MKPKLFIGSSFEGLDVAHAIQRNLYHIANVTVWDQGVSQLSTTMLESLLKTLRNHDFGVFVFSPDDITRIRKEEFRTTRDNVIFELGLFAGRLGRERSFIVMPEGTQDFHLPTDLLGIIPAKFHVDQAKENLEAALGAACHDIRKQIKRLGKFVPQEGFCLDESDLPLGPSLIQSSRIEGLWLSRFEYKAYRNNTYVIGLQYDIEHLKATSHYTLYGENISCVGSSKHTYWHQLRVSLYKNSLIGIWLNTNTENVGCFQLNIHSSCAVMLGQHIGNANNNSIQPGDWKWIKIDYPEHLSNDELEKFKQSNRLKSPDFLDTYFSKWIVDAMPISLAELQDQV